MKIQFYNRDIGQGTLGTIVQGYSGRSYGNSRFDPKRGHHSVTIEVKDEKAFETMMDDMAKAWHLPMRKWVPQFIAPVESALPRQPILLFKEEELQAMKPFPLCNLAKAFGVASKGMKKPAIIEAIIEAQRLKTAA